MSTQTSMIKPLTKREWIDRLMQHSSSEPTRARSWLARRLEQDCHGISDEYVFDDAVEFVHLLHRQLELTRLGRDHLMRSRADTAMPWEWMSRDSDVAFAAVDFAAGLVEVCREIGGEPLASAVAARVFAERNLIEQSIGDFAFHVWSRLFVCIRDAARFEYNGVVMTVDYDIDHSDWAVRLVRQNSSVTMMVMLSIPTLHPEGMGLRLERVVAPDVTAAREVLMRLINGV